MKRTVRFISIILFTLILFTACVDSEDMIDGMFTAKTAWFIFFSGLLMISISAELFVSTRSFLFNRIDTIVILFIISIIINNTVHDSFLYSTKNIENIGLLVFYFLSKRIFANQKKSSFNYVIALLFLTSVQITIAYLQWFDFLSSNNSIFSITGFFFNSAPFAIFLSVLLVFLLSCILYSSSKSIKLISVALFLAGLPVILIADSRSAWIGMLAGVLIVLGIRFQFIKKLRGKVKSIYVKILAVSSFFLIVTFAAYNLYNLKKDSADGRLLIWKLSLKMIENNTLRGIGQGNFPVSYLKYQAEYFTNHPESIITEGKLSGEAWYAFNDILQITAEQGLVGLLLFGAIIFIVLKLSYQLILGCNSANNLIRNKAVFIGATASLLVVLVSGLFSYPLTMLPLQIMFYSFLAILSASRYSVLIRKPLENNICFKRLLRGVVALIYFTGGIYILKYGISVHNAYKQWYNVEDENVEKLKEFNSILRQDHWYLVAEGESFFDLGRYNEAILLFEQAKKICSNKKLYYDLGNAYESVHKYDEAEKQYKFISDAMPALLQPKYLLAKLYYKTGQTAKWDKKALEVINFKPKVQSWMTDNMIYEIKTLYYSKN